MSEEPLFDPSPSRSREDPLGADADPTTPAPDMIESTTAAGDAVDMGPTTAHEQMQMQMNGDGEKKTEDDEFKAMFGDLKKKKKKKEIPMDFDLDFSDIKKKKKSSKKKANLEEFERQLDESKSKAKEDGDEDDEVPDGERTLEHLEDADLGDDPFAQAGGGGAPSVEAGAGDEPWLKSDRDYTYPERYTIAPPSIHREGNKKSIFANVTDICKRMHRQPEHVIQFLFAEMGTTGSVDGAGRLVIKGRFQQKQIENVLRRYIVEYVTCKTCKSPDTLLTKENRIFFMSCESCGSRRSVNPIKSGFQAQVGRRSKNKTG
ncbi:domain found in IF2B/IF5-domain-containing protein [Schizophyllum amplum]|uniref:Domain found in IF2B/IF5-domain-containing protein n=1 Tax=Schizophyllum amplum TaxID=97359 RepID=A0A550CBI0_9AGAR|nr:domain found in IF2B/IF5-domain-containing protein [Auriculariopsis ampla]